MYKQVFDPVSHSLGLTSIFSVIPIVLLFGLLLLNVRAYVAAAISVLAAIVIAVAVYSMPLGQAADAGIEGAAYGLFPIMWIVLNAIWIYNMTVRTGHFDVLRRSIGSVSDDQRIQAVIIAFCFGSLLEALAGFGTPVAICAVMLVALGVHPFKAAGLALIADTAPVAFGALAVPIITLSKVTTLPIHDLGSMVGRQTPILALFVPFALVLVVDGLRGLRETFPVVLACGVSFAIMQYATSNFLSVELTDIVAALVSAAVTVLTLKIFHPTNSMGAAGDRTATAPLRPARAGEGPGAQLAGSPTGRDSGAEVARAYSPYLIIIVVFVLATQVKAISKALAGPTHIFKWPGLHLFTPKGKPLALETYTFNWLSATGTLLLFAGVVTMLVLSLNPRDAVRAYGASLRQLATAFLTVALVLGLAYIMNSSGEVITLGQWMAGIGAAFVVLSPIVGWLGVAITGSDTSSNALFGALQVAAAKQAHLSPLLLAAGNSSGGVLGKMISPQNLVIGASAVGLSGQEGKLLRAVLKWSVIFVLLMCVLVFLQSNVLSGMVPPTVLPKGG
ncbi:MAG: L-lactate permease [Candidatus Dormibacteria bacterium]